MIAPAPLSDPLKFILAGNAIFTARSEKTGIHFTFRVRQCPDEPKKRLWFAQVLCGPNNEEDYQYLGTIRPRLSMIPNDPAAQLEFSHGVKSRIRLDAPSAVAARWVLGHLLAGKPMPGCTIFHEGRCGRCGRKLTVPESISSGFGPECISLI